MLCFETVGEGGGGFMGEAPLPQSGCAALLKLKFPENSLAHSDIHTDMHLAGVGDF